MGQRSSKVGQRSPDEGHRSLVVHQRSPEVVQRSPNVGQKSLEEDQRSPDLGERSPVVSHGSPDGGWCRIRPNIHGEDISYVKVWEVSKDNGDIVQIFCANLIIPQAICQAIVLIRQ